MPWLTSCSESSMKSNSTVNSIDASVNDPPPGGERDQTTGGTCQGTTQGPPQATSHGTPRGMSQGPGHGASQATSQSANQGTMSMPEDPSGSAWARKHMPRVIAALILAGCVTVLGLASWMSPDPRGLGTHEQLGMSPCGFARATGWPCMTCGMTTAFTHCAHNQWWQAWLVQPAGTVAALITACTGWVSLAVLVKGADVGPITSKLRPRLLLWVGGFVLAAWLYKLAVTWSQMT